MENQQKKHLPIKPILLIAAVVVIVIISSKLGVGERLGALQGWIRSQGVLGPLVFTAVYAGATVAALPGSALSILAGAIFGPVVGVITVIFAATLGASLAFLVSRYFARRSIEKWLEGNEKFRKLDDLTAKHGDIMVAITRLVPIFPFNLLNYGFGLTRVRFRTYVVWSFVCMLPGTILYVVGSAAVVKALREGKVPWILVVVVALILGIIAVLSRQARKRLREGEEIENKT
ncbi:MAG: TVP38/TMEM64 family protein [bacterium]|nr:TVP38/TMEM64 family protein [bacterium]MDT8366422.1 TVP38/TMEM64 family protein [bacterium]